MYRLQCCMHLAALRFCLCLAAVSCLYANTGTEVDRLYKEAASDGNAMKDLTELCTVAPGRLEGTDSLQRAVAWAQIKLATVPGARVTIQEIKVPGWRRGKPAQASLVGSVDSAPLAVLALGFSGATPATGIEAEVVEVHSLAEVEKLGRSGIAGKIVFYNRPMDREETRKGTGYGKTVDQRSRGPAKAASFGALAVLVRSVTFHSDDIPHTGITVFKRDAEAIPAAALGIQSAERLSRALKANPQQRLHLSIDTSFLPEQTEKTVVAEIRGTEFPDQYLVVGGHIDSWDNTPGAHDNGAGVVQSIEAFRLLAATGPKHSLRCVLFTCEEIGSYGGAEYARRAKAAGEKHIFAIESDAGGFAADGLDFGTKPSTDSGVRLAKSWGQYLGKHGITSFLNGHGGTDIGPLQDQGTLTAYLTTDPLKYFVIHHAATDSLDKIVPADLAQGAGTLAAALYLADRGEL